MLTRCLGCMFMGILDRVVDPGTENTRRNTFGPGR